MTICENCNLPNDTAHLHDCYGAQSAAMRTLLTNIGDPGKCRGCSAEIFWVTHKNGKKTPYTPAGLNHFVDCPAAKQFGKKA